MSLRNLLPILALASMLACVRLASAQEGHAPSIQRGAYILAAAGCVECHTRKGGSMLAGGRSLKTPFGIFFSPNITPDPAYGIGRWSEADFRRALRDGVGPDGTHYFPVFPYPSFTKMTDEDIADLFAYLKTVPPAAEPDKPHDIRFPFDFRPLMVVWNWLYLKRGPLAADPGRSAQLNRGAYLVEALGHCGECHTPRNSLGALDWDMPLTGTETGPDGDPVPNLTPDKDTGLGKWSDKDITYLLETGFKPDGDNVGGTMGEVVDASTSKLTADDRVAIAAYLKSIRPIRHLVTKPKTKP
jgi:mono/diheme cytochrome c family protein